MCVYVIGVGVGRVHEMCLARSGRELLAPRRARPARSARGSQLATLARVVGSGLRGLPWPGPASHIVSDFLLYWPGQGWKIS